MRRSRSTLGERVLERAFEGARDEPVLGLAGVELAARAVGLELGALEREALAGEALRRAGRSSSPIAPAVARDAGRGDGLQERGGDGLVEPPAAERLAGAAGAVQVMAAHARIAAARVPSVPE